MTNSKYDAYLKIGVALKNGDEKVASDIAKIIIKSDRQCQKRGIGFTNNLLLTRSDKRILNKTKNSTR